MAKNDITINVGSKYNGEGLQKAEQAMSKVGSVASKASGQLKNITNAIGQMPNAANQALNAVNKLGAAFAQGGVWGAGLAIVGLAIAKISEHFEEARKRSLEFAKSIQDNISNAMDKVSEKTEHLSKTIKRAFDKKNFDIQIDTQNTNRENRLRDLSRKEGYIDERKGMTDSQVQRSRIQEEYDNATKNVRDNLKVMQNEVSTLQNRKMENNLQIRNLGEKNQASLDTTSKLDAFGQFLRKVQGINEGKFDKIENTGYQVNSMGQTVPVYQNTGKNQAIGDALKLLMGNGYSDSDARGMLNAYQGNNEETNKAIEENQRKLEEQRKSRLGIQDQMKGYQADNYKIDESIKQKQKDIQVAEYEAQVKVKAAAEKRAEALKKLEQQESKEVELIQKRLEALGKQLKNITDEEERQKALEKYDDEILKARLKVKELQEKNAQDAEKLKQAQDALRNTKVDYTAGDTPKDIRNRRRQQRMDDREETNNVLKVVKDAERRRKDGEANEFQGLGLENQNVRAELVRRRTKLIEKYGQKDKNGDYMLDENGNVKMNKRMSRSDRENYEGILTALKPTEQALEVKKLEQAKKDNEDKARGLNKQIEKAQANKEELGKKFKGQKTNDDKDELKRQIQEENNNLNQKQKEFGEARNRKYGNTPMSASQLMNIDPNSLKKRDREALAQRKGSTLMTNELLEGMSKKIEGISKALGVKA